MPDRFLRLAAIASIVTCLHAQAATWHVSPQPLASIPAEEQTRTINEAAQKVQPGDVVLIHSGVYRETVRIEISGTPEKPIRFEADPASAATVIVTGADVLTNWKREDGPDNIYSTEWTHVFIGGSKTDTHPDDNYHLLIGRCEQVFIQGEPLRQVLDRAHLERGTFFADLDAKRLFVWSTGNLDIPKRNVKVEASVRSELWNCRGAYVQVRGLHFRYAANMAQHGAAEFSGQGDVVEDCTFERMNSSGATFRASDLVVRRCKFEQNGQLGFGGEHAHRLLFSECVVRENNLKRFDRDWEAGGEKLVLSRGVVFDQCRFIENHGVGAWFDIGNEDADVHNCYFADNEDAGLFYEISYGLHAHDNVFLRNGLADTPSAWGVGAGLSLSSSPGCTVERNLFVANREGFSFRESTRRTPRIDAPHGTPEEPIWNHDETIRANVFAYNRDAQLWGWFDINDERHWPAALHEHQPKEGETPRSLETLNLKLTGNLYATADQQRLFTWGVGWKRHKTYATLEEVQHELGLESGSRQASINLHDYASGDLRVTKDSPVVQMDCYPRGPVLGIEIGILP